MRVRGVVCDSGGEALEWAAVSFAAAPTDVPDIAAMTNERGEFILTAPVAGRYRLGVRAEDRAYCELDVDVTGDVEVEIELGPELPNDNEVSR